MEELANTNEYIIQICACIKFELLLCACLHSVSQPGRSLHGTNDVELSRPVGKHFAGTRQVDANIAKVMKYHAHKSAKQIPWLTFNDVIQ